MAGSGISGPLRLDSLANTLPAVFGELSGHHPGRESAAKQITIQVFGMVCTVVSSGQRHQRYLGGFRLTLWPSQFPPLQ